MRKELEAVIREEGWSKASVGKLHKLDSFIKESLRLSPLASSMFSPPVTRVRYLLQPSSRHAT